VIYDLIVVGNGLAGQTFLFKMMNHLKLDVNKRQNFSIAQISSPEVTPACSLRSTATVSLNGIDNGVSDLGNELRDSFFLFKDFVSNHRPFGVEEVKQLVTFSHPLEKEKMIRRYKNLNFIKHPLFRTEIEGVELNSFLIDPIVYGDWYNERLALENIDQKKVFLRNITTDEKGLIICELINNEKLKAHKIVLCTGAYAKIFSQHFAVTEELESTQVVAGSFLEKSIELFLPSFYLILDGHHLIYRSQTQTLILGSASLQGAITGADFAELKKIYDLFSTNLNFSLGSFSDFRAVVGLRHKAKQRRPFARALNKEKSVYMINGFYKNGFTLSHLCADVVMRDIFLV
jgi:hypothetical protein